MVSLGVLLYAFFGLAKIALWIWVAGPTSYTWVSLLSANTIEALAWTIWILVRYGRSNGPALAVFPLVCSLYASVPVALLSADLQVFPFSAAVVWNGMVMQSVMATHVWVLTCSAHSKASIANYQSRLNSWIDRLPVTWVGIWIFLLIGLAIACFCLTNFYLSGASALIGNDSRLELTVRVETGKLWLLQYAFECWLIICGIVWASKRARSALTKPQLMTAMTCFLIFIYPYLQIGNRRELMTWFVFCCVLLFMRGRHKTISFLATITIPAFLYLGLVRENSQGASLVATDPLSFYLNLLGEFVFPHFPLLDRLSAPHHLWMGWSYLRLPAFVVPTFGLWHRPASLAIIFAQRYSGGSMGYAYTPLGEGFANFGALSVIIVPLVLVAGGRFLASRHLHSPIPFLIFLAFALEINRGEFISITLEFAVFVVITSTLVRILNFRLVKEKCLAQGQHGA